MSYTSYEMSKSDYIDMFTRNSCSVSSINEIKTRSLKILKYLKKNETKLDEDFWQLSELYSILPAVEQSLKAFFINMISAVDLPKKRANAFSSVLEEFENLLTLIYEQISSQKLSYVIIPCVCSIASMMYYVDETYAVSQDILITIFARFNQLRFFIVDTVYGTITVLQSQNLIVKYVENITKIILLLLQSVPTAVASMNDGQFEKTRQQLQALTIHWISLFMDDINSKSTSENVSKIFNQMIRHTLKMLLSYEFPSSLFMLTVVVRKMMSSISSSKNGLPLKKFALEQICFIIMNLKKVTHSYADSERNNSEDILNIYENVKSKLEKPKKCVNVQICLKILLIRYMEKEYKNNSNTSSPVPFFRFNFLRFDADGNEKEKTPDGFAKKRKINESFSVDMDSLKYYNDLLTCVSVDLKRREADIIYKYLLCSSPELRIFVDRYFEKIILLTSANNNSIRLSVVKQLLPLIEANNRSLSSRILKIAIRSLILDQSFSVRENILIVLTKIVLLYDAPTYAAIFEENCENILMRLLDVNLAVRKAVLNLLKNFCFKNRKGKSILKILSFILCRVQDKNEAIRFQTLEIFKQLWFSSSQCLNNSVLEALYLSNKNPNQISVLFKYMVSANRKNMSVVIFDLYKEILSRVAIDGKKLHYLINSNFIYVLKNICSFLNQDNVNFIRKFIKRLIRLKQLTNVDILL